MQRGKNSFGIPYVQEGPPGLKKILNAILGALDAARLQPSADIDALVTPTGTLANLRVVPPNKRPAAATRPLQVQNATTGAVPRVSVVFGMLNNLVPTIGGLGINTTSGSPPVPPSLDITATGFVVLAVTTNVTGTATAATIAWSGFPLPGDTATLGHIALAFVSYYAASGGNPARIEISDNVSNSLQHQQCGGTTHLFGAV